MMGREEYNKIMKKISAAGVTEPSLARVGMLREVLSWMGNPDKSLRIIYVAGTNGRGSTGAILTRVLSESNYRIGHFSSQAVKDDLQMITVNEKAITTDEVVKIVNDVITQIKRHGGDFSVLSRFEWWVLIALIYFDRQNLHFVVFEAGHAGDLDATRVIAHPFIVAFTKISVDNVLQTGQSLTHVAEEKSKIIKPGSIVVSYPGQEAVAFKILKKRAEQVGAIWNPAKVPKITVLSSSPKGLRLNIDDLPDLYLSLTGNYQAYNLSTVLQIIGVLRKKGFWLSNDRIATALAHVSIPGRMEFNAQRNVLYDGADTPAGISGLIDSIKAWHLPFKPVFVLGVLDNKNAHDMIDLVADVASTIIAVTPNSKDAMTADALASYCVHNTDLDIEIADDPSAAVQLARHYRESSHALVVVTGSFYTLQAIGTNEKE
ncbi:hypothetical protein IV73_GL000790 [Weissella kandleri]|uniref:Mur ligase central domain-containing protein n=1 Tax=Weissella kandleri TaxID=1616 RepID=A0A0R2JCH9_9LACO|nr:tetrahydrofolate synthase [Weissella kandleri]KRN75032.1 hypothetical protein IV73_GL000790 [Weissella kandleri]